MERKEGSAGERAEERGERREERGERREESWEERGRKNEEKCEGIHLEDEAVLVLDVCTMNFPVVDDNSDFAVDDAGDDNQRGVHDRADEGSFLTVPVACYDVDDVEVDEEDYHTPQQLRRISTPPPSASPLSLLPQPNASLPTMSSTSLSVLERYREREAKGEEVNLETQASGILVFHLKDRDQRDAARGGGNEHGEKVGPSGRACTCPVFLFLRRTRVSLTSSGEMLEEKTWCPSECLSSLSIAAKNSRRILEKYHVRCS
eukprot:409453-Hanusia_phi.AAC.1